MSRPRPVLPALLLDSALVSLGLARAAPQPTHPTPPEVAPPRFVRAWGQQGAGAGELHTPLGIAVGAADRLFVADFNNGRAQRFDPQGQVLGVFEVADKPGGITLDRQGGVSLSLWDPDRIAAFTEVGEPLHSWSRSGRTGRCAWATLNTVRRRSLVRDARRVLFARNGLLTPKSPRHAGH